MQKKTNLIDWTIEHASPQIEWDDKPDELNELEESENKENKENFGVNDLLKSVKKHLLVGIAFKWKF